MTHAERLQARRVFEDTLRTVQAQYAPVDDVMVEARVTDDQGHSVLVARYKCSTDGRVQCFEVLDEVLWPRA